MAVWVALPEVLADEVPVREMVVSVVISVQEEQVEMAVKAAKVVMAVTEYPV